MTLVVDASVALKWFVEEPGSAGARTLLTRGESLIAPDLIVAETLNAAWKLLRTGLIVPDQHAAIVARLPGPFQELAPIVPLVSQASSIGRALGHPIYDCFYIALAEKAAAKFVTADRRLVDRIAGTAWQPIVRDLYGLPANPSAQEKGQA